MSIALALLGLGIIVASLLRWRRRDAQWREVVRRKFVDLEDQIRTLRLDFCNWEDEKTGVVWDLDPDEEESDDEEDDE